MSRYQEIADRESRYLLNTYARYPLVLERGRGVFVYDVEGRRYLDLVGGLGVNALGHAHPRIVRAIRDQVARAIHVSNLYYHEYQGRLAEKLTEVSGMSRVFFCNSGTEAIEGALKLARAYGHSIGGEAKSKVVAVEGSFHGRTFGALSVTGQPKYRHDFEPLLQGVTFVNLNDVEALQAAIDHETCALMIEPIQGEGGIYEASNEYLRTARALADQHKAVLVFDEIQCGLGRTGDFFAFQRAGVTPDVVTVAKPLAAGLPLGAFLAREEISGVFSPGKHGTTFGGGPLACRVALEFLTVLTEEGLLEQVRRVGAYLHHEFERLMDQFHGLAVEARGRGMIQALQLTVPGRPVLDAAMADGLLINVTQEKVLRVLPPYILEEKHVDQAIKVLRKALKKIPAKAQQASA